MGIWPVTKSLKLITPNIFGLLRHLWFFVLFLIVYFFFFFWGCSWWNQRTTCGSCFSPSTMWALGSDLKFQAWQLVPLPIDWATTVATFSFICFLLRVQNCKNQTTKKLCRGVCLQYQPFGGWSRNKSSMPTLGYVARPCAEREGKGKEKQRGEKTKKEEERRHRRRKIQASMCERVTKNQNRLQKSNGIKYKLWQLFHSHACFINSQNPPCFVSEDYLSAV